MSSSNSSSLSMPPSASGEGDGNNGQGQREGQGQRRGSSQSGSRNTVGLVAATAALSLSSPHDLGETPHSIHQLHHHDHQQNHDENLRHQHLQQQQQQHHNHHHQQQHLQQQYQLYHLQQQQLLHNQQQLLLLQQQQQQQQAVPLHSASTARLLNDYYRVGAAPPPPPPFLSLYPGTNEMSLSSDFPISMADDFLLPLSPGDVPAVDPEDQLLNDMEQKYFSEFLDTFSGGEMTTDLDRLPMPSPLMGEGLGLAVFDDMNRKQQQRYQSSQQQQPQQQTSNIPAASSSNTQIMAPRNVVDNAFAPHSIFSQSAPAHSGNWPVSTNSSHVLSTSDKPMPVMAGPPQPLYINTQSLATSYPPSVLAPHLISSAMDVDVNNSPTSATSDRNSNGARKMSLPTTPSAAAKSRSSSGTSTPSKSTRSSRATPKDAKRRGGRELLTEEEKRTNHIMSEQKRRNLIRTGFRALAELVPGLKGGNMGSSKSVILYNTVGFIQHLEQGNRALGDQLDVLHKRYQQQQQMQHHQQQGLTIDPGMAHGQPHHGQPSHAFSHPPTQADQTSFQPPPPSNPPQQAHLQAPQPQQASQPNPTFPETQTPTSTSTSSPFDTTSQPQTSRAQVVQA